MGRIAEALRRAQQERNLRLGQMADTSFADLTAGPERVFGRGTTRVDSLSDMTQSLLDPPPPPQPFPITAPPILSESVAGEAVTLHDPN